MAPDKDPYGSYREEGSPRCLILDTKEAWVKLNESIIIGSKLMDRQKILANVGNVQDIAKI